MYNIMQAGAIFGLIVTVFLLIMLVKYIMKDVNTLSGVVSAQNVQTIQASSLASSSSSSSGSSVNFSYSIWFYIDDWNYRYGEPKVIFGRTTTGSGEKEPCPSVVLGPIQNNIVISMAVFPGLEQEPSDSDTNYVIHNCSLANVPVQRWVNLLISVYGRTLDTYIDGKLVKTCVLPGVPNINSTAPLYVTPNGGFSGWTSKFQYWPNSTNPQSAWNVYKAGYGGSMLGNMFGQYTLQISLMEGDTAENTWTL